MIKGFRESCARSTSEIHERAKEFQYEALELPEPKILPYSDALEMANPSDIHRGCRIYDGPMGIFTDYMGDN